MLGAIREGVSIGATIRLQIWYTDVAGNSLDPSTTPTVTIINPSNNIIINADSTSGVTKQDIGIYYYDYTVPDNAIEGSWQDAWHTTVNSISFNTALNFKVIPQASPVIGSAGPEIDPELSVSGIKNVLSLMKLLRARLGSDGVRRKRDSFGRYIQDAHGEYVLEPCNVFATDELYTFLKASLSEFNAYPHFTNYNFEDLTFVNTFSNILTEGAFILALAKQALLERGREFMITDDGLSYQPPTVAEFIKGEMETFMNKYYERLKVIKCSIKPSPIGAGTCYSLAGGGKSTAFLRLRHLRARQVI